MIGALLLAALPEWGPQGAEGEVRRRIAAGDLAGVRALLEESGDGGGSVDLWVALAAQEEIRGDLAGARRDFEEAARRHPSSAKARAHLAGFHRRRGETDAALRRAEESVSLDGENPLARYERGVARRGAGRLSEAREDLGIAAEGGFVAARLALAQTLESSGDRAKAGEAYRAALREGRGDPSVEPAAARGLADTLFHFGRYEEAIPLYEALAERDLADAGLRVRLGQALVGLSRWAQARQRFEEAVALRPEDLEARSELAWILERTGTLEEAWEAWTQCLRRFPDTPVARLHLGRIALARGLPQDARPHLEHAARSKPESAEALVEWGRFLLAEGRNGEAVNVLKRAAEIDPLSAPTQSLLGQALAREGKRAEARVAFERFRSLEPLAKNLDLARAKLRASPGALEARLEVLRALVAAGRTEDADRFVEESVALLPDHEERIRATRSKP